MLSGLNWETETQCATCFFCNQIKSCIHLDCSICKNNAKHKWDKLHHVHTFQSVSCYSQQRRRRRWYSWCHVATLLIPHYLSNITSRQQHHSAPGVCFEEAVCWLHFLHVRTGSKCQRTSGPQSRLWSQHSSKHGRGAFRDASDKCLAACWSTKCEPYLGPNLHKLLNELFTVYI